MHHLPTTVTQAIWRLRDGWKSSKTMPTLGQQAAFPSGASPTLVKEVSGHCHQPGRRL